MLGKNFKEDSIQGEIRCLDIVSFPKINATFLSLNQHKTLTVEMTVQKKNPPGLVMYENGLALPSPHSPRALEECGCLGSGSHLWEL